MVNLDPHPLVPQVATDLIDAGVSLKKASELASIQFKPKPKPKRKPKKGKSAPAAQSQPSVGLTAGQAGAAAPASQAQNNTLALQLAGSYNVPELVTFTGYVGASFTRDGTSWCLLYLDTRLLTWLLLERDGVVYRQVMKDEKAPFEQRDVVWVKADASVGRGMGSLSVEAQFLTGEFTRAGDFEPGLTGGTMAAATGVFCEADSVGCCTPKSNRPR
jgi:hypothetical protein